MTSDEFRQIKEACRTANEQFGRVTRRVLDQMRPALTAFAEWSESPEGKRELAAARFRRALAEIHSPCHCACALHSAAQGICTGTAVREVRYETDVLGTTDVPMCAPCAEQATGRTVTTR